MDYVISANLRRRHLSESQREQAMANLCTLARGRPASPVVTIDAEPALFEVEPVETNTPIGVLKPLTTAQAADKAGVGFNTMARAIEVDRKGSPELIDAVKRGDIAVSAAAQVVKALPDHAQQNAAVEAAKDEPRKIVAIAKAEAQKPKMRGEYATLESWGAMTEAEQVEFLDVRDTQASLNRRAGATALVTQRACCGAALRSNRASTILCDRH